MANANLSIRVDKETKEKANELFKKFGLTMTTAVNMFLKTAIRENRIPFELKLEEEPNEVTLEAMREADRIARDDSMKLLFAELIISLNMEILVQNILALLT